MAKKKKAVTKEVLETVEKIEKLNDPVGDFTKKDLDEFQCKCSNLTSDIRKREAVMVEAKRKAKIATENFNEAIVALPRYVDGFKKMPLLNQTAQATPVEDLDIEEWIAKAIGKAGIYMAGALDEVMREGENRRKYRCCRNTTPGHIGCFG